MSILQRIWPWSEIARLKDDAAFSRMEAAAEAQRGDEYRAKYRAATTDRDQWIKTATRLRVERDQAKDALAKVGGETG